MDIEVESRQIRVEAADATRGRPDPDRVSLGSLLIYSGVGGLGNAVVGGWFLG